MDHDVISWCLLTLGKLVMTLVNMQPFNTYVNTLSQVTIIFDLQAQDS